ncbi:MAG TPA: hypothetical protein VHP32_10835 [Ignavibacteria bacterium]|nr:hypothetical protein [Ignavibacteria bacterium]
MSGDISFLTFNFITMGNEILTYTQIAINIIVLLLFLFFVILVSKLIKGVDAVKVKVDDLNKNFAEIKTKIEPSIEKFNTFIDTANMITEKANTTMDTVNSAVDKVKYAVDDIVEFEQKIKRNIEPSIMDTIHTYSGIVQGVKTFIEKYKSFKATRKSPSLKLSAEVDIPEKKEDYFSSQEFQNEFDDIDKELNEVRKKLEELRKD